MNIVYLTHKQGFCRFSRGLTLFLAHLLILVVAGAQRPQPGAPKPFQLPKIEQRTLTNGLTIYFLPDHRQPAVWMRLVVRAGQVREPADKPGLASFVAEMLTKGTAKRGAEELAATIEQVGGSLSSSVDKDLITIAVDVRKEHADLAGSLLAEVAMQPAFKPEEIEVVRTQVLNALQDALSQPGLVADYAFNRLLFGSHPYGAPERGTPQSVEGFKREDLAAFHQAYFAPNNATLYLAGDLTAGEAFKLAEKHFGQWARKEVTPTPAATPSLAAQIVLLDRPGSTQTEIRIGTLTPPYRDPIRIPAYVMNGILGAGGDLSRLTQIVRVQKGLTYAVFSDWDPYEWSGRFVISLATKSESTREALDLVLREFQRIRTEPVPQEELEEQKTFLIGSRALVWESTPRLMRSLIFATQFGEGIEQLRQFTQRVAAVNAEEVQRAAQSLPEDKRTIVLVGDASKIESSLQGLGTVRKIPMADLDLNSSQLIAQGARAFLQKMLQAHGGEKLLQVQNVVGTGKGSLRTPAFGGEVVVPELTFYFTAEGKNRLNMETAFGTFSQIWDGERLYFVFPGGNAREIPEAGFAVPSPMTLAKALNSEGYSFQMLEAGEWEGKGVQPIEIKDPAGQTFTAYFNLQSQQMVRVVFRAGLGTLDIRFSDYKVVEGIPVPYKVSVLLGETPLMSLEFEKVELNQKLDPDLFKKPED